MKRKGIILAGGTGSRLYPVTKVVSKQLMPIYDKPMIYYPLSVLMLADIRDILIITTPEDLNSFKRLLGDGSDFGINLSYAIQHSPDGLAQAFIIAEKFIGNDLSCLILGDNIFYGHDLEKLLNNANQRVDGATIFAYHVKDPERYGVVSFASNKTVTSIEEKPKKPKSNFAITGLYFYDNDVIEFAKSLSPSDRGELEITDLNKIYLKNSKLKTEIMNRGFSWLDTGTHQSLLDASIFIETLETRQGLKIACLEEIALKKKWIRIDAFQNIASSYNNDYGNYLLRILNERL
jgi:glucose-1-phosphate thymidylyltransferase